MHTPFLREPIASVHQLHITYENPTVCTRGLSFNVCMRKLVAFLQLQLCQSSGNIGLQSAMSNYQWILELRT